MNLTPLSKVEQKGARPAVWRVWRSRAKDHFPSYFEEKRSFSLPGTSQLAALIATFQFQSSSSRSAASLVGRVI
jgi:hypothetical protein